MSLFVEQYTDTCQRRLASRRDYAWEASLAGEDGCRTLLRNHMKSLGGVSADGGRGFKQLQQARISTSDPAPPRLASRRAVCFRQAHVAPRCPVEILLSPPSAGLCLCKSGQAWRAGLPHKEPCRAGPAEWESSTQIERQGRRFRPGDLCSSGTQVCDFVRRGMWPVQLTPASMSLLLLVLSLCCTGSFLIFKPVTTFLS